MLLNKQSETGKFYLKFCFPLSKLVKSRFGHCLESILKTQTKYFKTRHQKTMKQIGYYDVTKSCLAKYEHTNHKNYQILKWVPEVVEESLIGGATDCINKFSTGKPMVDRSNSTLQTVSAPNV